MSKVMNMSSLQIPRFVSESKVKQENDEGISTFFKDELDFDLIAEYFLEDVSFDFVGGGEPIQVAAPTFHSNTLLSKSQGTPNSASVSNDQVQQSFAGEALVSTNTATPLNKAFAPGAQNIPLYSPFVPPPVNQLIHSSTVPAPTHARADSKPKRQRVGERSPILKPPVPSYPYPEIDINQDSKTAKNARPKTQAQIERRRERNKILARRTRLRKKFFFESLQKEVADLQAQNHALKALVRNNFDASEAEKVLDLTKEYELKSNAILEKCGIPSTIDRKDFNFVKSLMNAQKCFIITDPSLQDNPIVYVSENFSTLTGYARDDVLGRNCRFLQGPETSKAKIAQIQHAVTTGEDVSVTIINYTADGTPFWNNLFIAALRDAENNVVNYIGILVEVAGPDHGDAEFGKPLPPKASESELKTSTVAETFATAS